VPLPFQRPALVNVANEVVYNSWASESGPTSARTYATNGVFKRMSTVKEEAINLIVRLPDEASWDDIMYEMYVKKKIESGIKASDEGRVTPHEEVKRMFRVE